jgi:hypothetical protein
MKARFEMDQNPVILLSAGKWHIVEHSRRSETALCGQKITNRMAHTRLKTAGEHNVCPKCLKIFNEIRQKAGG